MAKQNIDVATEMYQSGGSLRSVERDTGIGRETLRKAFTEAGIMRGRLGHLPDPFARLIGSFSLGEGCWLWRGPTNNHGYGVFSLKGRRTAAHRAVYKALVGEVSDELDCCHACDNPRCVRPDHIFVGTRADNMQDAKRKGRLVFGSAAKHAVLTEGDVREIRKRRRNGETVPSIASRLGVGVSCVQNVVRGATWGHVT